MRLAHAVDWGDQEGIYARWGANAISTSGEAHIGIKPKNADAYPFFL